MLTETTLSGFFWDLRVGFDLFITSSKMYGFQYACFLVGCFINVSCNAISIIGLVFLEIKFVLQLRFYKLFFGLEKFSSLGFTYCSAQFSNSYYCNSATAGPRSGMQKEEGKKNRSYWKISKSRFLTWLWEISDFEKLAISSLLFNIFVLFFRESVLSQVVFTSCSAQFSYSCFMFFLLCWAQARIQRGG